MADAIGDLRPTAAKSRSDRDLSELQLVRDALVGDRKSIGNRGKHLRHPVAKRLNKQRLAQIERQLVRVEAEIRKLIEAREDLKRRFEILTSIPGISNVTAAGLITHMPASGPPSRSALPDMRTSTITPRPQISEQTGSRNDYLTHWILLDHIGSIR